MAGPDEDRDALRAAAERAQGCVRCPQLAQARRTVVFGEGPADAELMFVGEAPGAEEDRLGRPLVGRSGRLLDELLEGIGLRRDEVYVQNVLCCRPPGNRDPLPVEIDNCRSWLLQKVELVRPTVLCTLGTVATRLLRGRPTEITRVRGRVELREVGGVPVRLYPLFHPAAALYAPANVHLLREDFARIPALLAEGAVPDGQLGLF